MEQKIIKIEDLTEEQYNNMFENWYNSYNFVIEDFTSEYTEEQENDSVYLKELAMEHFENKCVFGMYNFVEKVGDIFFVIEDYDFTLEAV